MLLLHFFFFQQLEHIAGLGDFGQIEFRPDLSGSGFLPGSGRARLGRKVPSYLFSLVNFDGAGMRLLFGHANFQQHIQDGFTLYFKLPGQIIDSNLRHPLCFSSKYPLRDHNDLTVSLVLSCTKLQSFAGFFARL
jgi:hypothetical protein